MSILAADGSIKDAYRNFIALSRYARFRDDLDRRETWGETVDRYITWMSGHLERNHNYTPPADLLAEIREAIREHEVMPSMRAMMTAGEALERDHMAAYNCSYLPIQDVRAFSEILYILMCGTGVGYSVERMHVNELPDVPTIRIEGDAPTIVVVDDSKEGWAIAFDQLLRHLWTDGVVPTYDLSQIRPAGAPLKTFGGRASGPEPLRELFQFTIDLLFCAQGRKLTSLEVHDLACKIASAIVVGGVRRSAMIALTDLDDEAMATAKSGEWWKHTPHRALANISAVYQGTTSREQFDIEWANLVASGSGERGIFNRTAAQKQAAKNGFREDWIEYGTNPCSEIILRPFGLCNLTEVVVRPDDTIDNLRRKVRLAAVLGTWQATLTRFRYVRDRWALNAEEERLLGVSLTGVFGHPLLGRDVRELEAGGEISLALTSLSSTAFYANNFEASRVGIPASNAITCVKPSGTVSQLTGVSAGLHPWHSPYICRTIRADAKDPLAQLMIDAGFPHEQDVMQPSNWVFSFPQKAPDGAVTRAQLSAIEHLKLWLTYQRYWCDHKPSVTVSVRPEEWDAVKEWVWNHLDELSGVAFLPYADHTYQQAPYQEIEAHEYGFMAAMQDKITARTRWADLSFYETSDQTTGSQELACSAGGCEVT